MQHRLRTWRPERLAPRLIALAACCWLSPTGALGLTLEEAISTALTQNPGARQFASRTTSAGLGVDAAETEFAFRIHPESTLSVSGDEDASSYYGLRVSRKNRYCLVRR